MEELLEKSLEAKRLRSPEKFATPFWEADDLDDGRANKEDLLRAMRGRASPPRD
jgi:hypothetical protein